MFVQRKRYTTEFKQKALQEAKEVDNVAQVTRRSWAYAENGVCMQETIVTPQWTEL